MSESNSKVIIGGKEYTMKDVSILRTKMLGMKYITGSNLDKLIEWIGDEAKEKASSEAFGKFLDAVFTEQYSGPALLELPESEVMAVTSLFFKLAAAQTTQS